MRYPGEELGDATGNAKVAVGEADGALDVGDGDAEGVGVALGVAVGVGVGGGGMIFSQ